MIRHVFSWQFMKFILVGIVNTLFSTMIYSILLFFNLHYAAAAFLAAVIGALFNFKTIGHIVFRDGNNSLLFRFMGVYLVSYLLNVSALRVFAYFHSNMYVAGLIVALPMAAVSFLLLKKFVYRNSELLEGTVG